jgi:hypothetical protein
MPYLCPTWVRINLQQYNESVMILAPISHYTVPRGVVNALLVCGAPTARNYLVSLQMSLALSVRPSAGSYRSLLIRTIGPDAVELTLHNFFISLERGSQACLYWPVF